MMKTTKHQYDIKHTGEEMDRAEILHAFGLMADMIEGAGLAEVNVSSMKNDLICVEIITIDQP